MYPSAGPRLGVFNVPGPQTTVMPPAPPNLAEVHVCIDRGTMCTVINIHNTSFCEIRVVFKKYIACVQSYGWDGVLLMCNGAYLVARTY